MRPIASSAIRYAQWPSAWRSASAWARWLYGWGRATPESSQKEAVLTCSLSSYRITAKFYMFGRLRRLTAARRSLAPAHTRGEVREWVSDEVNRFEAILSGYHHQKNVRSLNVPLRSFGGRYDLNSLAGRSVDTVADFRRATD